MIERKGMGYLLNAYAKIKKEFPNTALLFLGSGPSEFNLRSLSNYLELRDFKIIQSGLSLNELVSFYSVADLFVLPTLEDVWGFVINEAMACGLPVISTKACQASYEQIINVKTGLIVKETDTKELYLALKRMVSSNMNRVVMVYNALFLLKTTCSVNNIKKDLLKLLQMRLIITYQKVR